MLMVVGRQETPLFSFTRLGGNEYQAFCAGQLDLAGTTSGDFRWVDTVPYALLLRLKTVWMAMKKHWPSILGVVLGLIVAWYWWLQ